VKKHLLAAALLLVLLVSELAGLRLGGLSFAQPSETLTIKADGTVEPSTAPIRQNGSIYTLTTDIDGSLTVEKSHCIINGAGHHVGSLTLRLVDSVAAVYFNIENTEKSAEEAGNGVFLDGATDSIVAYNNVSGYDVGVYVAGPSWDPVNLRSIGFNNLIAGNNITENYSHGVYTRMDRPMLLVTILRQTKMVCT
jgi:hypothetical protein